MGKSSRSKTKGDQDPKKPLQSKALANLMNYENEDSESANEDSNEANTSQLQPASSVTAMQPRSILGTTPVKFAVKKRFEKFQAFGIKPKAGAQGTIRIASKWDDPDDDETSRAIPPPVVESSQSGIKKLQLYESESSREGTPISDDRGTKKSISISLLASKEVSQKACYNISYVCYNIYWPQRSWAKVIFSEACVKNSVHRGGGGCLPRCMLGYTPLDQAETPLDPGRHPPVTRQTPPGSRHTPPGTRQTPPQEQTPPGSRLQHTVYERPVRIILECILVLRNFRIVLKCRKKSYLWLNPEKKNGIAPDRDLKLYYIAIVVAIITNVIRHCVS